MIRVFLDASVFFAGIFSKQGASAVVLAGARHKKIHLCASRLVLREADRNLRIKGGKKAVKAFHRFLRETKVTIFASPTEEVLAKYESAIHPKDVPVLAAALEAGADYLLTLDRRHFLDSKVRMLAKSTKIMTPADFLEERLKRY